MPNNNDNQNLNNYKTAIKEFLENNPGSTVEDFNRRRELEGLGPDVPENIHHTKGPLPWQIPTVRDAMVKNERGTLEHTEESKKLFGDYLKQMKYPGDYVAEGMTAQEANLAAMQNLDYYYTVEDSIQNQQGRYQDPNFIETMKKLAGEEYTSNIPPENKADFLNLTSAIEDKNVSKTPYGIMDPTKLAEGYMTIDPNDPFDKKRMDFWDKEREAREGGWTGHRKSEWDIMMEEMGGMRDPRKNRGGTAAEKLNRLKNNRNFMNNPPPTP